MYDYLLRFDSAADRDKAFPVPEGSPASWNAFGGTVVPVTIWIATPQGKVAAPGFWIGMAASKPLAERHAATIVEMQRPDTPTYWHDCIVWAAVPEIAPIAAVEPVFAGSDYVFDA